MKIIQLAPEVIDQIAAGEVVERPAHLIKELVENSLDAGATEIEVEVDDGGRSVSVIDNGRGISREDLHLALARHATSKIRATEDIWALRSFGFRGEALASIASVSELTITSRTPESGTAYRIQSQYGKISDVQESGGTVGTRLQIRELFSNIPARLKFLKTEAGEIGQIKNVLKALAMANPSVQFKVKHKGKVIYFWPSETSLKNRVSQILEQKEMYDGVYEMGPYKASVVLGSPKEVVRQSRQIWIFVQGRWVQDRSLQAAVMEGYRNLLMHGEFPVAAIFVECDPEDIDVNIHPAKSQVKFREPNRAFKVTVEAVRKVLSESPWIPAGTAPSRPPTFMPQPKPMRFVGEELDRVQYSRKSFPLESLTALRDSGPSYSAPAFESPTIRQAESDKDSNSISSELIEVSSSPCSMVVEGVDIAQTSSPPTTKKFWSSLHILGQANLTYILAQDSEKLYLIDQHAAHERVAFESLMAAWQGGRIDVQTYLVPLALDFDVAQTEALLSVTEELQKLGVSIEAMGPETVAVNAAPALLNERALSKALDQVGREVFEKGGSFAMEKVIADLCATMACHSVIRAGKALSYEEMASLLQQMDEYSFSSFCPHGRPVSVEYSFTKIEKEFGRIV